MNLILARHGNTFAPGDKVFYVGSKNDLPLVEQGEAQAERVGSAFAAIKIAAAYFAPLQRTKRFAEIAVRGRGVPLIEDERLIEVDYGEWSGLSDDEIAEKFGKQCLDDWAHKSIWPRNCNWSGDENATLKDVENFVSEILEKHPPDANVLVVSSNGKLRYFLHLVAGEFERRVAARAFKVGTGRVCLLVNKDDKFTLAAWNEQPEAVASQLLLTAAGRERV